MIFHSAAIRLSCAAITGLLLAKDLGVDRDRHAGFDPLRQLRIDSWVLSLFSIDWFGRDRLLLRI